jgi:hypothetical protein
LFAVKFDDLMLRAKTPECADEILAGMDLVLAADDLTANDKAGFATGFLMGLTYGLGMSNEQRIPDAARTLLRLQSEWQANGVL